jgi:Mg/Co/Ni transporter MgtE
MELRKLIDAVPILHPEANDREVAAELASYDLLAAPVCDRGGRLLGAVTVDDVLDRMLGSNWRKGRRPTDTAAAAVSSGTTP